MKTPKLPEKAKEDGKAAPSNRVTRLTTKRKVAEERKKKQEKRVKASFERETKVIGRNDIIVNSKVPKIKLECDGGPVVKNEVEEEGNLSKEKELPDDDQTPNDCDIGNEVTVKEESNIPDDDFDNEMIEIESAEDENVGSHGQQSCQRTTEEDLELFGRSATSPCSDNLGTMLFNDHVEVEGAYQDSPGHSARVESEEVPDAHEIRIKTEDDTTEAQVLLSCQRTTEEDLEVSRRSVATSPCSCACWTEIESLKKTVLELSLVVQQLVQGQQPVDSEYSEKARKEAVVETQEVAVECPNFEDDKDLGAAFSDSNMEESNDASRGKVGDTSLAGSFYHAKQAPVQSLAVDEGELKRKKANAGTNASESSGNAIFENNLVLGHIFKYCTVKDLVACRQVSKMWYDSSLEAWTSSVEVAFIGSKDCRGCISRTRLPAFMTFLESRDVEYQQKPFATAFRLYNKCTDTISFFWKVCGASMKMLNLFQVCFPSAEAFRNIVFRCFPNLETLTLAYVAVKRNGRESHNMEPMQWTDSQFEGNRNLKTLDLQEFDNSGEISWLELLSQFPSLEKLSVQYYYCDPSLVFKAVGEIRKRDPNKLKLNNLCIVYISNTSKADCCIADVLSDRCIPPPLETLIFGQYPPFLPNNQLILFLNMHARTLKKLIVEGLPANESEYRNQCQLENLQELKMYSGSLEFFRFTPNLRKLVFRLKSAEELTGTEIMPCSGKLQLLKCKDLTILNDKLDLNQLQRLREIFPNVQKLTICHVDNELFTLICERWTNLVSLTLEASKVDDAGITGLDDDDVKRINDGGMQSSWRPITVPRANVTAFKCLENLDINKTYYGIKSYQFGHCAFVCGLQYIAKKLKHLEFLSSELKKFV